VFTLFGAGVERYEFLVLATGLKSRIKSFYNGILIPFFFSNLIVKSVLILENFFEENEKHNLNLQFLDIYK